MPWSDASPMDEELMFAGRAHMPGMWRRLAPRSPHPRSSMVTPDRSRRAAERRDSECFSDRVTPLSHHFTISIFLVATRPAPTCNS